MSEQLNPMGIKYYGNTPSFIIRVLKSAESLWYNLNKKLELSNFCQGVLMRPVSASCQ